MALTAQKLALRLAKYIGVTTFDPGDSSNTTPLHQGGLREGDIEEVIACMNGALQEMWGSAARALCFARQSFALRAPVGASLQVSKGSVSIVSFLDYGEWMEGCSVDVSGDGVLNEVDGKTALLRQFGGETGLKTATVYSDCVTLGAEVVEVCEPVSIYQSGREPEMLRVVTSWAEFEALRMKTAKLSGVPSHCFVDTRYFPSQNRVKFRVRVYPLPYRTCTLTFGVRLNAPQITEADVKAVGDPGRLFPIPHGWDEAVLLPLALQRFTAHPSFEAELAKKEIARQADVARQMMRSFKSSRSMAQMVPTFR
jgi:hypothetical protein